MSQDEYQTALKGLATDTYDNFFSTNLDNTTVDHLNL